ncbi:hypothetical protein ACWEOZ_05375 [Actinoplanes sp. NPDC004185]
MPEQGQSLHLYGEAYGDPRPPSSSISAPTATQLAEAAMTRAGVIYEVEVTSGVHATRPTGVPTWEEFKQRHFVDGVPLPVRPRPRERVLPPSWPEMVRAVEEAHRSFRTYLVQLLTAAFPGRDISVSADQGPLRRSAASVDWSEESYGFEVTVDASIGDLPPADALDRVSELLTDQNWDLADRVTRTANVAVGGSRELYSLWVDARPLRLTVLGQSPLYRAPAEPGTPYVVEPR